MMKIPDPLKYGFYYVEYTYMDSKKRAVYFTLEPAQEAMVKMIKRGVDCHGLHEWKPKLEIISYTRR
jgi:hypothetical protein